MAKHQYLHIISRLEDVAAEIRSLTGIPTGVTLHLDAAVALLTTAEKQQSCSHANVEEGVDDFYHGIIEYAKCRDCGQTLKHDVIK